MYNVFTKHEYNLGNEKFPHFCECTICVLKKLFYSLGFEDERKKRITMLKRFKRQNKLKIIIECGIVGSHILHSFLESFLKMFLETSPRKSY